MAILSELEYRVSYFIDAFGQPLLSTTVEVVLWAAIFNKSGMTTLNGFGPEYYLAYALWSTTVGRIAANWMYEFKMVSDIDDGSVNSTLVRPISFYEYYLFQYLGYKFGTAIFTFWIPAAIAFFWGLPGDPTRLPLMMLLVAYNLIFVHTVSFVVATLAFHLNRSHAFTMIKNMILWVLSGEVFPLDLLPEPIKSIAIHLPFASGVYIPVGYMTGRFGVEMVWQGFLSLTVGIAVVGLIGFWAWSRGLRAYSGTGA